MTTPEELAAIAARHVVIDGHCQGDGPGLPCDVVPLLDELAALRSQRDLLAAAVVSMDKRVPLADVRLWGPDEWAEAVGVARSIEP